MPADSNFFKKFPNNYFIESGTYIGTGCEQAILANFKNIYSFEINPQYHTQAKQNLSKHPKVKLFLGDTTKLLWDVIKDINDQITFWLDGHYFLPEDVPMGQKVSTIEEELAIIAQHPVKTHIILIDDVRLWASDYKIDKNKIAEIIKKNNSNYGITFETGHATLPNDILVAKVYA